MKSVCRCVAVVVCVSFLAASQAVFAGDCCKKAAESAKAGKSCEKCLTDQCCKEAAAKVAKDAAKDGKAKACTACAAKAKEEKKTS
jgi:hypothetical protein